MNKEDTYIVPKLSNHPRLYYKVPVFMFIIGLLGVVGFLWINNMTAREFQHYLRDDEAMHVQSDLAEFHNRLDTHISNAALLHIYTVGDEDDPEIQKIWGLLEDSRSYIRLVLNGGINHNGIFVKPLKVPELRSEAETIDALISSLVPLTEQRIENARQKKNDHLLHENFNAVMERISTKLEVFMGKLDMLVLQNYKRSQKIFYLMLAVWILVFSLSALWIAFIEKKRKRAENELEESRGRYVALLDTAAEGIIIINTQGIVRSFNKAAEKIFGYKAEEVTGKNVSMLMPEPYKNEHDGYLENYLKTGQKKIIGLGREVEGRRSSGEVFPVYLSVSELKLGGTFLFMGIIRDITERKRDEEEIQKLSRAVEQSPAIVMITDPDANIEYVNPKFTELTGYTFESVKGKNPRILKSGHTTNEDYKNLWETITSGGEWRGEFLNKKKSGELYWESAHISSIKDHNGKTTHYLAVKEDITERKSLEEELKRLATTDQLTLAYNRVKFDEIMEREMENVKRYGRPMSVVMFDIDYFKNVNDKYGHAAGDYVLKTIADIVRINNRKTDYLVRWGGEEFIVIAPEADIKMALKAAERIRSAIESYEFKDVGTVTVSIGVTRFIEKDSAGSVVDRADQALYRAKKSGRNRVETA